MLPSPSSSLALFLPCPGKSLPSRDPDFEKITMTLKPLTESYENFTLTVAVHFKPDAKNELVAVFYQEHNIQDGIPRNPFKLKGNGEPITQFKYLSRSGHGPHTPTGLQQRATFTIQQLEALDTKGLFLMKRKMSSTTSRAQDELHRLAKLTLQ